MPRWEPGDFKIEERQFLLRDELIAEASSNYKSGVHRSYRQAALFILDRYYPHGLGTNYQRENKINYLATKIRKHVAS